MKVEVIILSEHLYGIKVFLCRGMSKYVAEEAERFQKGLPPIVQINNVNGVI